MPVAYLIIAPAMASFDVALEESSRVFGAGTWRTLIRVTLPVLRPAILAAFILGVVRGLASFAMPSVLGMPGRVNVLSTYLYQMIATGFAPDYGKAAAVGMSVLVTSITLIIVYRALTAESEKYVTISGRGYRPTVIELKAAKIPLFTVVALLSLILIVLPVAVLFYTSLVPYSMVPSARAFSLMSWKHWIEVRGGSHLAAVAEEQPVPRRGRGHPGRGALHFRGLRHRQSEDPGFRSSRVPELPVVLLPGHRHRRGVHVVLRSDPAVRHHLGAADRLHRHLSALWHSPAGERLRPGARTSGGVVARLRGEPLDDHAPDHHPAAHSRHRLGVDPHGQRCSCAN